MEKRVVLAIVLVFLIFAGWQKFYLDPIYKAQQLYRQNQNSLAQGEKSKELPSQTASNQDKLLVQTSENKKNGSVFEEKILTLRGETFDLKVSTKGGMIVSQNLSEYKKKDISEISRFIETSRKFQINGNTTEWNYLQDVVYEVKEATEGRLQLYYEDKSVVINRSYSIGVQPYSVEHILNVRFLTENRPAFLFLEMQLPADQQKVENEKRTITINKEKGQEAFEVADLKELKEDIGAVHWMNLSSRYFMNGIVDMNPDVSALPHFQMKPLIGKAGENSVVSSLVYPVKSDVLEIKSKSYFGPKDVEILKAVHPRLSAAVDYGWFTVFAFPLLEGLKVLNKFFHNYGLAIIFLTVLVKLLTYPLSYKSVKSMKDMQRIQPQIQKLKEKHGEDKEALNKEMLQLMRTNGYNPMSGCFPVLIQMPIYVALYNVLNNSIELYGQPFFGWIVDLSQKDPYFITPALLAIMMFLQQKMTPNTAADPAQQKMMTMMPLMFGVMMLWLPSGLTLYMLVNSLVSIGQQIFINKRLEAA